MPPQKSARLGRHASRSAIAAASAATSSRSFASSYIAQANWKSCQTEQAFGVAAVVEGVALGDARRPSTRIVLAPASSASSIRRCVVAGSTRSSSVSLGIQLKPRQKTSRPLTVTAKRVPAAGSAGSSGLRSISTVRRPMRRETSAAPSRQRSVYARLLPVAAGLPPAGVRAREASVVGRPLLVERRFALRHPLAVRVLQHQPHPLAAGVRTADRDENDGVSATVRGFRLDGDGVDPCRVPLAQRNRPRARRCPAAGPSPSRSRTPSCGRRCTA